MPEVVTITDLCRRTGLASSALRFYERKGLIRPIGREGGKRVYAADSVEQVALIDLLKHADFTLGEIAALVDTDGRVVPDWRDRARRKLAELDERLAEIRRARAILEHAVDCPHELWHDCPTHQQVVREHAARRAATSRAPSSGSRR